MVVIKSNAHKWSSHLPVLIKAVMNTKGPILELGGGLGSTPFLHWATYNTNREVVTYESDPKHHDFLRRFSTVNHKVLFVKDWDDVPTDRFWQIAFIDHAPAERRIVDIARLANTAEYIIVHDVDDNTYKFDTIYSLFKYRQVYKKARPKTAILSNFTDPAWILP